MELTEQDKRLIGALRDGLPLAPEPYRLLGDQVGLTETEVLHRLRAYTEAGLISRFGIIVRHAPLGWRANAMVVWDVPDADMTAIAPRFAALPWVNLCYRRPRRPPEWPYNLFTMIHGRERTDIATHVAAMCALPDLPPLAHAILYTTHHFKQTAACYGTPAAEARHG